MSAGMTTQAVQELQWLVLPQKHWAQAGESLGDYSYLARPLSLTNMCSI